MAQSITGQQSLDLHKERRGKIEIKSKVRLNTPEDLTLAYTPGVGSVSLEIAAYPETVRDYTIKGNAVAIVSDGSAVLGLGNLGASAAIPVMEGKAALFKQFANIDAFPICLDTQDPEEIIATVKNIAPIFGGINLEDIAAPNCFYIEDRLKEELNIPVMHDDQHGTAVVVLAALINAMKVKQMQPSDARVVINGAGAAGTAIAKLLLTHDFSNLVVCDSKGIISPDRLDLNEEKQALLQLLPTPPGGNLADALNQADVFIGVSKGNLVTTQMVQTMADQPVVFALANPIPEIMPEEALAGGALIMATGRSDFPNQINNVLAFPGIFRGALDNNVTQITDAMLVGAAENLAACTPDPVPEKILPGVFHSGVAQAVAQAIHE